MRVYRKPTGYLVKFWYVTQSSETSSWGSGAGEEIALSLRQLTSILRRLNQRHDMQANVIPIWGPLTSP